MEYNIDQLEDKMTKFANESDKLGDEWSVKQGKVNSVKDRKEDYLAKLMQKCEGTSNAEKERNARCSEEWTLFKEDLHALQEEALILKVKYETAKRNWETARSLLSSANTQKRTAI